MSTLLFGRLPGQVPVGLHDLTHYVAGCLPKPPARVAVPKVADWQILGNDQCGDCGVAGLHHQFMADAADTGATEAFPSEDDAVSYYLSYTGGQDAGVVLSDYLAHVRQAGYYGHTVAAYAPVTVRDIPTLQFAVWAYDAAYCGITVTEQMQADFADGRPWTMESLDSPVAGGHCVPIVGYDSQHLHVVTWGQVQKVAYSAWHYLADEAWAVITGELGADDGHGVSLQTLRADLDRMKR